MNEENIKQVEFRLKKLRDWKKRADELQQHIVFNNGILDAIKATAWNKLKDKQETTRALLYEDFEALADTVLYELGPSERILPLMVSIFKECRR